MNSLILMIRNLGHKIKIEMLEETNQVCGHPATIVSLYTAQITCSLVSNSKVQPVTAYILEVVSLGKKTNINILFQFHLAIAI